MAKTPDEMKELVEGFIKVTGVDFTDQTQKVREKSTVIQWQYHVGTNVTISKNANRNDRIHININMRFTTNDSKLLVMSNPSFSKTVMEISQICTICNVGHQWIKDKDDIVGLGIFSHVDEQKLDRVTFHDAWDNVARVSGHAQKILRSNFNGMSAKTDVPEKTMYG